MSLACRALLIWVVALAIPLQGLCALAQLRCGPSLAGHQQAASLQPDSAWGAHAEHPTDACGHTRPDGAASDQASAFQCSACCAGCPMAAMLGSGPVLAAQAVRSWHAPLVWLEFQSGLIEGLERPPRSFA